MSSRIRRIASAVRSDCTGVMTRNLRGPTVPATELAMKHVGRPVPNVPLLGAFAALGGLISLEAVHKAIQQKFHGKVAQGNMDAASEAYAIVMEQERLAQEAHHA